MSTYHTNAAVQQFLITLLTNKFKNVDFEVDAVVISTFAKEFPDLSYNELIKNHSKEIRQAKSKIKKEHIEQIDNALAQVYKM